jgi:hypothetical protein
LYLRTWSPNPGAVDDAAIDAGDGFSELRAAGVALGEDLKEVKHLTKIVEDDMHTSVAQSPVEMQPGRAAKRHSAEKVAAPAPAPAEA